MSKVNLLQLVLEADLDGIRRFLADGGDVNFGRDNGPGATGLIIAAAFSTAPEDDLVPIVKELLHHGCALEFAASINNNPSNMRALHYACAAGRAKIVKVLLEAGAEVNVQDGLGQTPLILAMNNRYEEIIELLLEHNADAKIATSRGATPLIILADPIPPGQAVKQDYEKDARIAQKLIQARVDVNGKDDEGKSALHWCARTGHHELAHVLLSDKKAEVNIQDKDGVSPLLTTTALLIRGNNVARVEKVFDELVQHGADENLKDNDGISPFGVATRSSRPDLMKRMDQALRGNFQD